MSLLSYELDLMYPETTWHYVAATAEAKANFVYLQEIGRFFAGPKYYTTRLGLDSFLLKLTISGGGIVEYGGHTEKVGPDHFFWIDCMNHQHYYTDPSAGHWDVIWAHFSGAAARAYYEIFRKWQGGVPVGKVPSGYPMYNLLETLLNQVPTSEEQVLSEQNLFATDVHTSGILTQLMVAAVSVVINGGSAAKPPPVVQEIRAYLAANYTQKITLEYLANKFSLDPYYLQKLFKRYNGQSPSQYIIHLRITRAKILMRTTNLSIGEIASEVGIDNISFFVRQFKKMEGMTPMQFRKFWPVI